MRGRGAHPGAGAADFRDDDGLLHLPGAPRGREEFFDVADALDEQQDHIGRGVLHQVVQELAGAEIGFVTGADDVAHGDAERLGTMIIRKADAAALRDDADPLRRGDQRHHIRLDVHRGAEGRGDALHLTEKALGVGA